MKKVKWVLFDWRNTLVDGRKALRVLRETRAVENILQDFGISFSVEKFEAGGEKSSLKPFKVFLEKANKIEETTPAECIMVGDRSDEDAYAKEMGFYTILLNPKRGQSLPVKVDKVVNNLDELLQFLKSLFSSRQNL